MLTWTNAGPCSDQGLSTPSAPPNGVITGGRSAAGGAQRCARGEQIQPGARMSDARAGGAPSGRAKRGSDREEGQGDTPTASRPRSHGPSHGAAADDVDRDATDDDDAPVRGSHLAAPTPAQRAQPAQLAGQISTLGDLLRATNVHVGKSKQRRPLYAGGPQRCAHGEQIQPGAWMSDARAVHLPECGWWNFVEEDMAVMVKQRHERPLRLNTLVTRVLSSSRCSR